MNFRKHYTSQDTALLSLLLYNKRSTAIVPASTRASQPNLAELLLGRFSPT